MASPGGINFCRTCASSPEILNVVDDLVLLCFSPPPKIKWKQNTHQLICWHVGTYCEITNWLQSLHKKGKHGFFRWQVAFIQGKNSKWIWYTFYEQNRGVARLNVGQITFSDGGFPMLKHMALLNTTAWKLLCQREVMGDRQGPSKQPVANAAFVVLYICLLKWQYRHGTFRFKKPSFH